MKITSPAAHINLRETADPVTGLKPNGTVWFPVLSVAVSAKGTGRMKNVHFSGQKRESGLTCHLSREKPAASWRFKVYKQFRLDMSGRRRSVIFISTRLRLFRSHHPAVFLVSCGRMIPWLRAIFPPQRRLTVLSRTRGMKRTAIKTHASQ